MIDEAIKQEAIENLKHVYEGFLSRGWLPYESDLNCEDTLCITNRDTFDETGKIWVRMILFVSYLWKKDEKTQESRPYSSTIRTFSRRYDREAYLNDLKKEGDNAI